MKERAWQYAFVGARGLAERWAFLLILSLGAGCTNTEPGQDGDPCNHDAEGTDGCDSATVCINGSCHAFCSSNADCPGSSCTEFRSVFFGNTTQACRVAGTGVRVWGGGSAASAGGGGGSAGGGGGSSSCTTRCQSMCTGRVPEQACLYCQAACLCRCANNSSCAQQNAATACSLGTCGC